MILVGFDEADVIGEEPIEELEEVAALVVGLLVIVIARFVILFGVGCFRAERKDHLTILDHRLEGDVLAELELEARRAEERCKDVGAVLEGNILFYIERDVLLVQLEVHHGDVQDLAAFQLLVAVLHDHTHLDGILVDNAVLVKERFCGDHEGANILIFTVDDHACGKHLAALNEGEFGVLTAGIPESHYLDRYVAVGDLFQRGCRIAVLYRVGKMLVVKCEIEVGGLAIDIRLLTAHAKHVRLHRHRQICDQHLGIQIQILIVGVVALLLCVDVNKGSQLLVFLYQCGEVDASVLICVQIELVRNARTAFVGCVRGNDDVDVRQRFRACVLKEDEIIVGLYGVVRDVGNDVVLIRVALAPDLKRIVTGGGVLCPARARKVRLKACAKRLGCIVVDLFARCGDAFGDVVDRTEVDTVAKGARADVKLRGRAHYDLLDVGIGEEGGVIDLGDGGGYGVIDALDACGIAVQHALVLGVQHAVAVVEEMLVLRMHCDVRKGGAVEEQIVAVNTADLVGGIATEVVFTKRDAFQSATLGECLATNLLCSIVHRDLFYVFRATERLGGNAKGNDRRRIHIVKGNAILVFGDLKGRGELQKCDLLRVAAIKQGSIAHGAIAVGFGEVRAIRAVHRL